MPESAPSQSVQPQTVFDKLRGLGAARKKRRITLRMTAMIDVIFLLLTFFVLTAKFRRPEEFLPIQLPKIQARTLPGSLVEPLAIHIDQEYNTATVRIGQSAQVNLSAASSQEDLAQLAVTLQEVFKAQNRFTSDPVEITCENQVEWDWMVKIYHMLYAMGIENVSFTLRNE